VRATATGQNNIALFLLLPSLPSSRLPVLPLLHPSLSHPPSLAHCYRFVGQNIALFSSSFDWSFVAVTVALCLAGRALNVFPLSAALNGCVRAADDPIPVRYQVGDRYYCASSSSSSLLLLTTRGPLLYSFRSPRTSRLDVL